MPFGLVNSQATFQRLMDTTLLGLKNTESYIDDCITFSKNFSHHLLELRSVFQRLREAKIYFKKAKCHFAQLEVEFLGHRISQKGRYPLTQTTQKIAKFPNPRSAKELQRFLGSLNYYRSYIPRLAQIANPLYQLTKKGEPWKWTQKCEEAFSKLRLSLIEEPITLAFPDWKKEFIVETDASSTGVAGVLSQRVCGTERLHPIDFFSSSLSPSQRNYSAGQLEAWAIVAAVRKWNMYLRAGSKVELVTDHNPLRWMRQQKDPKHTYARWLLELEEIPYVISYRPGNQNLFPDYLSRVPDLEFDSPINEERVFEDKICKIHLAREEEQTVRGKQKEDDTIKETVKQILYRGKVVRGQFQRVSEHLNIREGTLYFDDRIVVPKECRRQVWDNVHAAGHFGQEKTGKVLKRTYFLIKMTRDTKICCRECLTCHRAKASNTPDVPLENFRKGNYRTRGIHCNGHSYSSLGR